MNNPLNQTLSLPCGEILDNRIAKSAMSEGLATVRGVPTDELANLYRLWSEGGAGLLLTGNIMIDAGHRERMRNIVIDGSPSSQMRNALANWAKAGKKSGNHFWAQLNHPGRQIAKVMNENPKAPSAIPVDMPGDVFGQPVEMTRDEIFEVIGKFASSASVVKEAGFTGVQIHSAHGFLLSQFLSPKSNHRKDRYGGSLENRARLLLEVVAKVRDTVGKEFPVSVKLNSTDFQRSGFTFEDSLQVAQWLEEAGIDLLEISGGNYEQPKLLGAEGVISEEVDVTEESTLRKEGYFSGFADSIRAAINIPVMVTGGVRKQLTMQQLIADGSVDMIGIARPMCVMPDAPKKLLAGLVELPCYENTLSYFPWWLSFIKFFKLARILDTFSKMHWFNCRIQELGSDGYANTQMSAKTSSKRYRESEQKLREQC
ncbi:NADH:flavin oxidoreductase/NADH oxidase family protein [Maricurvus nonylphenolicus]|uniref:NADH:flavin oxidoreductase/NADH oxidase family protein n=1 Tax=Maricurvus nonylphenolicus TaxID=1008307 RepID=UPI0036F2E0EE